MSQSILTALLALLAAGLGFLWRSYSRAMRDARGARGAALEVIRMSRVRAEQDHTKAMETIDAKEAKLQDADSLELSSAIDSLFGGGGSVPQDDAGGGGSGGAM